MGLISDLTKYKVELEGKIHHEIGRFERSTGICCECNHRHKLTLKDRTFTCCGTHNDRDYSASISIRNSGERDLMAIGTIVRVKPMPQQKLLGKTKVFELSKLSAGSEEKSAA